MRARFGLLVWLFGLLFPLAWLGKFSDSYRQVFNAVFGAEWVHIAMHMALYAGLGILLTVALKLQPDRSGVLITLALALGVGVSQETIQLFSQGLALSQGKALSLAIFDLGVDLVGSSLGLGAVHWFCARRDSRVY